MRSLPNMANSYRTKIYAGLSEKLHDTGSDVFLHLSSYIKESLLPCLSSLLQQSLHIFVINHENGAQQPLAERKRFFFFFC